MLRERKLIIFSDFFILISDDNENTFAFLEIWLCSDRFVVASSLSMAMAKRFYHKLATKLGGIAVKCLTKSAQTRIQCGHQTYNFTTIK